MSKEEMTSGLDYESKDENHVSKAKGHHMMITVEVNGVKFPCRSWHLDSPSIMFETDGRPRFFPRTVVYARGFTSGGIFWLRQIPFGLLAIQPLEEELFSIMQKGFTKWHGRPVFAETSNGKGL